MIDRFIKSDIIDLNQHINTSEENDFTQYMMTYMKRYRHDYVEKTKEAQNVDKILSKKILQHLQTFFNKCTNANINANTNANTNANKKTRNRKPLKQKNKTIKNKMIKKIQSV
jgi:hypothetical protein